MKLYDPVKRALDIVVSLPLAVVTLPVQAAVAAAVRTQLGSPVLFRQQRPGRYGRPFELLKFRSMRNPAYEGEPDADRLTRFGRLLRSTSLDELPSLWNVVRGDMSLVGPRPLLMEYLELYTPEQARRHDVRPGVTGLAQVSGRNATTWEDRFAHDVKYARERSLALDLKILARTVTTVLRRDGISNEGSATMPKFTGSTQHLGTPSAEGAAR
ncbi:lipopolysaccharide/colanic/teichoic acid biosynthesis glycosyltransferase [Brachybacterium sp. AG952]|uniref:sugar transferase n=1 Tax=Brachybacterium sp. AG952 TaxID=2183989 RepID=UPI0010EA3EFA|nr:sugar transferase [Brachybacterium sp. AG952]TDP80079.1 lipopolysaccharide/colanic/teichoic acid biosynthesis glycosyltransferase [Brachybacterium sp. AG952]